MSLQCFVNGSLAREAVKDRFGYGWEAFSDAFAQTPPGNRGNLMLPFYRPEISPPLSRACLRLMGSPEFEQWALPDAAVRACVEGQMINMKRCVAWMRLAPPEIYLTGGASRNDAIAQVVADVFQARVRRLEVSGSVALGGAMRAAHEALGQDLESLAAHFCKPSAAVVAPNAATASAYAELEQSFAACLSAFTEP